MKRSWKRLISLILSVLVVATYSVPVFALEQAAADTDTATAEQQVKDQEINDQAKGQPEATAEQATAVEETVPEAKTPAPAAEEETPAPEEQAAFSESAKVDGVTVTVKAEKGVFPAGSSLEVKKVGVPKTVDAGDAAYAFDITILDREGNKIQPEGKAEVSFKTNEALDDSVDVAAYHMNGQKAEELDVETKGKTATVEAESFSTYVLTFTYNDPSKTYTMKAGQRVRVNDIASTVGLPQTVTYSGDTYWIDYSATESSDPSRLKVTTADGQTYVEPIGSDWMQAGNGPSLIYKYTHSSYAPRTEEVSVRIADIDSAGEIVPPVKRTGLVYNTKEQALVDPGNVNPALGKMQYNVSSSAESWSNDVPKAKDPGKYTVYWRVVSGTNQAVIKAGEIKNIEIEEAMVIPPETEDLSYDGVEHSLITGAASTNVQGAEIRYAVTNNPVAPSGSYDSNVWSTDYSSIKGQEEGTYYVWYVALLWEENTPVPVVEPDFVPVVIAPAEAGEVTVPEVASGLVYNKNDQRLIAAAGSAENGTFMYAVTETAEAPEEGWTENFQTITGKDAKEYFVWYKLVKADKTLIQPTAIPVTIEQAEIQLEISVTENLVFDDGQLILDYIPFDQEEYEAFLGYLTIDGKVIDEADMSDALYNYGYGDSDDIVYSAGQHTVGMGLEDPAGNYKRWTGEYTVDIAKATVVMTQPTGKSLIYNSTSQDLVGSGNVSTEGYELLYYVEGQSTDWALKDDIEATDPGEYTIKYKVIKPDGETYYELDSKNINFEDETGKELNKSGSFTSTIIEAKATPPTLETGLIYDGSDHRLIKEAGTTNVGKILYAAKELKTADDELPPADGWQEDYSLIYGKDAGEYKVWYKVMAGDSTVVAPTPLFTTIQQAENPINVTAAKDLTYNDGKALASVTNEVEGTTTTYSLDNGEAVGQIPTNDELSVGSHTLTVVSVDPAENYKTKTVELTIEIAKAKVYMTAPIGKTVTYNGSEQNLVGGGTVDEGFKLQFYIEGESTSWVDEVQKKDADTYTVKYKVVTKDGKPFDDSVYELVDETGAATSITGTFTSTIDPATVTLEWSPDNNRFPATGEKVGPDVQVVSPLGEDVVNAVFDPSNPNKRVQPGTYTAKVTGLDNENYVLSASAVTSYDFVVVEVLEAEVSAKNMTYGDNGTTKNVTVDGKVLDESQYKVTYFFREKGSNKWENWGPTSSTPAGEYEVTAEIEDPSGMKTFEVSEEPGTFTIAQKAITIRALDYWLAYGEKLDVTTDLMSDITGLTPEDEQNIDNVLKLNYTVEDGAGQAVDPSTTLPKGTYTIKVEATSVGTALENYNPTTVDAKLYVSEAADNPIELTVKDYEYGESVAKPTATAEFGEPVISWLSVEDYDDGKDWNVWNGDAGRPKDAGRYVVRAFVDGNASYAASEKIEYFEITKKAATIKLENGSASYTGSEIPLENAAKVTVTGEIKEEKGKITYEVSSDPTPIKMAGEYKLTATFDEHGDFNKNYSITVEDGKFVVSTSVEMTADVKYVGTESETTNNCVFDGKRHGIKVTPMVNGEPYANARVYYSLTELTSLEEAQKNGVENPELIYPIHAGKYKIYYYIDSQDYAPIKGGAVLDINSAYLRVKALDKEVVYGTPIKYKDWNDAQDQGFIDISAFEDSHYEKRVEFCKEYVDGLTDFKLNMEGYTDAMSEAGDYEVTTSELVSDGLPSDDPAYVKNSPDYIVRYIDATLTVTPKPVTLVWSEEKNHEFRYDGKPHSVEAHVFEQDIVSWNGKTDQDKVKVVLESSNANPSAATDVKRVKEGANDWAVGTYVAKIKELVGERAKNYKIDWNDPSRNYEWPYKIAPVNMYVTPNDVTAIYGDDVKDSGYTVKGLVGGDKAENVLLGLPVRYAFGGYQRGSDVGIYDITITNVADKFKTNGLHAQNYNVIAEDNLGGLTVNQRQVTLVWSTPKSFVYNGKYHQVKVISVNNDYAGNSAIAPAPTYTNNKKANAGNYNAVAKLSAQDAKNYKVLNKSEYYSWKITKRPATIFAKGNTIVYGQKPAAKGYYIDKKPLVKNVENHNKMDKIGNVSFRFTYKQNGKPGTYKIVPVVKNLNPNYRLVKTKAGKLTVDYKQTVLLAQGKSSGSKGVRMAWNKVSGAKKYVVYFSKCNTKNMKHKPKKMKTVKSTSFRVGNLKPHKCYKFYIAALNKNGKVIAKTQVSHVITANSEGKYTNAKSLKVSKKKLRVSRGGSVTITASQKKMKSGKKLLDQAHCPLLRYVSSNESVATVSGTGVVTGVSKGWCKVYVESVNGIWQEVQVFVK